MAQVFDVVGKSTPKRDGLDKVTGRTRYLHDLELPRLVHGKILRTRLPHARIVRIDTSRARALPGVLAVLTAEDVEQRPFGFAKDQLALKRGKVRCIRDEVAAVVAEAPELAEEALALIDVEYQELPAVILSWRSSRERRSCTKSSRRTGITSATSSPTATWTRRSPRRPWSSRTRTG
jgi:xanthine dehydrogenase molybdenum-binding subunit